MIPCDDGSAAVHDRDYVALLAENLVVELGSGICAAEIRKAVRLVGVIIEEVK